MRNRMLSSCIVGTLPGLSTLFLAAAAMGQTSINVKDLPESGLTMMPSTDVAFAAKVAALVGTPDAEATLLIPYSVVLTNSSPRTIRGYALQWSFVDKAGGTNSKLQVEQNFDSRQKGAEIQPGGSRVLSPFRPIDALVPGTSGTRGGAPPNLSTKLSNMAAITVSLDSVAFDNGQVIGPNQSFAMNVWSQMYAAQKNIALAALTKHQTGSSAALIDWLTTQSTTIESHPAGANTYEMLAGESHWYQIYAKMTAERLLDFINRTSVDETMSTEAVRLAKYSGAHPFSLTFFRGLFVLGRITGCQIPSLARQAGRSIWLAVVRVCSFAESLYGDFSGGLRSLMERRWASPSVR